MSACGHSLRVAYAILAAAWVITCAHAQDVELPRMPAWIEAMKVDDLTRQKILEASLNWDFFKLHAARFKQLMQIFDDLPEARSARKAAIQCAMSEPLTRELATTMEIQQGFAAHVVELGRWLAVRPEPEAREYSQRLVGLQASATNLAEVAKGLAEGAMEVESSCRTFQVKLVRVKVELKRSSFAFSNLYREVVRGTILNRSRGHLGVVVVRLALLDGDGGRLGTTSFSIQELAPGSEAEFEAPALFVRQVRRVEVLEAIEASPPRTR